MKNLNPKSIKKYWRNQKPPNIALLKARKEKFTDPYFPPGRGSLLSLDSNSYYIDQKNGEKNYEKMKNSNPDFETDIIWKRVTDVKSTWKLFDTTFKIEDTTQGSLGDCYFLSAITALAKFPYLIKEKFRTSAFNEEGYYEIIVYIDGEWQIVFIDDFFPYSKKFENFSFARPKDNEIWGILLEKCWAKINGGYSNIISGTICDPFNAFTEFPTVTLFHEKISKEDLFDKIIDGQNNSNLLGCSTKDKPQIEDVGLPNNHAYTIISAKQWKKNICLIKIRNPWGSIEWKGDWSENSPKWTQEARRFFGEQSQENGVFWISLDDYIRYFEKTSICYLLYGSIIKTYFFDYNKRFYESPLVFNLQIKEKEKTSIKVNFNSWRFNREIQDPMRPFSIVLCKYNEKKEITEFYKDFGTINAPVVVETLDPGLYALWVYVDYKKIKGDRNFKYSLSILSLKNFDIQYVGMDTQFKLIEYFFLEYFKKKGNSTLNSAEDYFVGFDREASKAGFSAILFYNLSTNKLLDITTTVKLTGPIKILPPYERKNKVVMKIPPKGRASILAFQYDNEENCISTSYSFCLPKVKDGENIVKEEANFDVFLKNKIENDNSNELRFQQYKYIQESMLNLIQSFNESMMKSILESIRIQNDSPITFESLSKEYPFEMSKLIKEFPEDKTDKVPKRWNKVQQKDDIYIGEINKLNGFFHGRGVAIITKKKLKYFGYWSNGVRHKRGLELKENNKDIVYEGEFNGGLREGKGKCYFTEKAFYEGFFKKGLFEGRGTFHFENGDTWEGNFTQGMKQGLGILTKKETGDKFLSEYDKDCLLGEILMQEKEGNNIDLNKSVSAKILQSVRISFLPGNLDNKVTNNDIPMFESKMFTESFNLGRINEQAPLFRLKGSTQETEEEKKEREFKEKINKLSAEEPFLMEKILELLPLKGQKENFQVISSGNTKYVGCTFNGKKYGRGGYFDGKEYFVGYFKNDLPVGEIQKFSDSKELLFKGKVDNNLKILNFGNLYFSTKGRYHGSIKDGKMEGLGTYYYPRGDSWTGNFVNNQKDGKGTYFYEGGFVSETVWYEKDKLIKRENLRRDDYKEESSRNFLRKIKNEYPIESQKLLMLPPFRGKSEPLQWIKAECPDGSIYIGEAKQDKTFHGRGCLIYKEGRGKFYIGLFSLGKQKGRGRIYDDNWNEIYEGFFEDGKKVGFGKELNPDGSRYAGRYENNLPNGLGVFYFIDGTRYEGNFLNGKRHGKGYVIPPDLSTKQKVEFHNGNIINQGETIDCTKRAYKTIIYEAIQHLTENYAAETKLFTDLEPSYDNNILEVGEKRINNTFYIGELNNIGFKHGRGYEKYQNKNYYVGYFINGEKETEGTIYNSDGSLFYNGNFKNNKPFGFGRYYFPNNEYFEGDFNEAGEGFGQYFLKDGKVWKGPFESWKCNGEGRLFNGNSQIGKKSYIYGK